MKTKVIKFIIFIILLYNSFIFSQSKIAYIDRLSDTSFSPMMKEVNTIYIYVISQANIKIQVLDSSNRVVFEFKPENNVKEGMKEYKWDGKDATGKIVSSGVYKYVVYISNIDNTYTYVEEAYVSVLDFYMKDIPPIVEEIVYEEPEVLPIKIEVHGVSKTQFDSTAQDTRSVPFYQILKLNLRSHFGTRVKSGLDLDLQ